MGQNTPVATVVRLRIDVRALNLARNLQKGWRQESLVNQGSPAAILRVVKFLAPRHQSGIFLVGVQDAASDACHERVVIQLAVTAIGANILDME
jgi:hypothetical protein